MAFASALFIPAEPPESLSLTRNFDGGMSSPSNFLMYFETALSRSF